MPPSFWAAYGMRLAIVGAVLAGLYVLGRLLRRVPSFATAHRCTRVIDARAFSAQPAVYVVRVGARCFLVGAGSSGVRKLAELAPADVENQASSRAEPRA
jgi:flagellar biogenesis protein FliO